MNDLVSKSRSGRRSWRQFALLFVFAALLAGLSDVGPWPAAQAQGGSDPVQFDPGIDLAQWYEDHEIESSWQPDYAHLASGDPSLQTDHGVYAWPFALDSIGWSMQSYQDYGGTPYFHHGMDMMKVNGTDVFNRSGGQVVNVENYRPGNSLYWEVAVLDPDGYIWQYHHVDVNTIPQYIWDKFAEYQADPVNGGFIPPDTYIGDIVYWPVQSFGKRFNHIHLNILAAGGVYVNGFEFHTALPDTVGPEVQAVGLLQNGAIYPGNEIEGSYSLYVRARDLVLDDVYYLPPFEIVFSVDGGPEQTTWRFDTLPGGADQYAYLNDFYVVPPTCGNYDCRDYYIDLGFIPDSQFEFPAGGGEHTVLATVRDYAGNAASQVYTYTVLVPPQGELVWQDDFETDLGWAPNPNGSDTASLGLWERGDPQGTYWNGPKQLGDTVSGLNDLVTGRLAGSSVGSYDVDDGVTSIRSPDIELPAAETLALSFRYYLAHGENSSAADYLRVKVVGSTTVTVLEALGAADNDDGSWALKIARLDVFAGQTVYLLIEAADDDDGSLVEAAIDDVLIVASGINQAPVASPRSVSTAEDTPLAIVLDGSDPYGDPLTFSIVSGPSHGVLGGAAPALTYTPTVDYYGADGFTFVVSDGLLTSAPATVTIEVTPVNDAPVAYPQSVTAVQGRATAITLSGWDVEGDDLAYSIVVSPDHGVLSGAAPDLTYTPAAGYVGLDGFMFLVHDGESGSAPAAVNIEVKAVVYLPVILK